MQGFTDLQKVEYAECMWFMFRNVMPKCNAQEWIVLCWLCERTIAFRKVADWVSDRQFREGVLGKNIDIKPLNISKATRYRVLNQLEKKGLIARKRTGNRTVYILSCMADAVKHVSFMRLNTSQIRDTTHNKDNYTDCAGAPAQELVGKCNMPDMQNVIAAAEAASTKSKEARNERKSKLNATALYKIWEDAFRSTYPDEQMFAWRGYEVPAFKKACGRGVPTKDLEEFVTFCVSDYDNVIKAKLSWARGTPEFPNPSFVISHIDRFYEAFRERNDPNRKLRKRTQEAEEVTVRPASKETETELELLRQEREALRKERLELRAAKSGNRKHRVKRILKNGRKAKTQGPFREWK